MDVREFDYELPAALIAQEPAERREASRVLVVPRDGPTPLQMRRFVELPDLLSPGDLLVVNDARVLPARLWARRETGGRVEILLLRPRGGSHQSPRWDAMVRPAHRLVNGEWLSLEEGGRVQIEGSLVNGRKVVAFPAGVDVGEVMERAGSMPLPPYIERARDDPRAVLDRCRYQTVYARHDGAVAAPTAGLHFTTELLEALEQRGIRRVSLTLDVGPGTFQPLRVDRVEDHVMEPERYDIPARTAAAVAQSRATGGRVVAVGTTVVRALEHAARRGPAGREAAHPIVAGPGKADLYIYPGFDFEVVDAMITNFHLPRSTPLLMVAAFAGRERILEAYRAAMEAGFRFYSYGDAMLIR